MASRLNPTNFGYQNFYSGVTTADITSGTLTISLDTVPTPTSGILVIEPDSTTAREVILYTSKGASTITCPSDGRGFDTTTATSHLTGSTVIMAPIAKWFSALASGELSTDPLRTESFFDYIASGCVWTADAAGSTRNGSMTSGVVYIQGRRLTVAAITAHTFTASKDTYVDFSDNGDGTALVTYTEATNNAASAALTTNFLRNAIIVTAAGSIAAAGSVNQGQEDRVVPIASSVPYAVTDSLGNLICPRDPNRRVLGYRQSIASFSTSSTSDVQVTGLSVPVIIPTGRKIRITVHAPSISNTSASTGWFMTIWDGVVGVGTALNTPLGFMPSASTGNFAYASAVVTPTTSSKTFNIGTHTNTGTMTHNNSSTSVESVLVELI